MADQDRRDDSPSLEPPSLGLGFRRKKKRAPEPEPVPQATEPAEHAEAHPESPAAGTRPDPTPQAQSDQRPLFADEAVPPPPGTPVAPAAQRADEAPTVAVDTRDAREPEPEPQPVAADDAGSGRGGLRWSELVERIPVFEGRQAAAVTGLLVGLLMVVATAISLRACDLVRGTATCGGGPGFLLLVATLILSIYAGSLLLRHWGEPDPGSTSFLAVGLVAVLALLFFVEVLLSWTMIVVIPLTAVGAFLLSHWVTTTYIEPADQ